MDLCLKIEKNALPFFIPLVEAGVYVTIPSGITIFDCLTGHFNLSEDYVEQRIQTIFLNHKPVDDIRLATLSADDRLAFSAAMPGLLGATMRKKGVYAAMRDSISYQEVPCENDHAGDAVRLFIRFFNMIAKEIGPEILKQGVFLSGEQAEKNLKPVLVRAGESILNTLTDEKETSVEAVLKTMAQAQEIFLTVQSD